MKILWNDKDGGPESKVRCWGLEIKSLFSVLVLRFDRGTRDAYHSHAFNAASWLLRGSLREVHIENGTEFHLPELRPIITKRETTHKVYGGPGASWVLSFRGPWADHWYEFVSTHYVRLTHGRQVTV